MINKLVILGLGLIGGSLAAGLRARGEVAHVTAWGRREASLARGRELGYIDDFSLDLDEALEGAEIAVIATPTLVAERVLEALAQRDALASNRDLIITDVASVKGNLLAKARELWGSEPPGLVLAHPIAGSEESGVEAARADLFVDHRVILTPTARTDSAALARVDGMWRAVGADVIAMSVARHDEVLAATSHLPHVLAYTLVDTLAQQGSNEDIFRFAAGGFRDFTRIASSDPTMWHDISLANRDALVAMIGEYQRRLADLKAAIEARDGASIMACYNRAKAARDQFAQGRRKPSPAAQPPGIDDGGTDRC